jgi:HlyD family secretion protein
LAGLKFRPEALRQISSPDRLDMAMRVVRPVGWLGVVACGLILAGAAAWAWFGTYRVTVQGQGLVHVEDGVFVDIFSPKEGWLEYLAPIGQEVKSGQLIARLNAPESSRSVDELTARLALLNAQRTASQGRFAALIEAERHTVAQRRAGLLEALGLSERNIADIERQIAERKAELARSPGSADRVHEAQERLFTARDAANRVRMEIASLNAPTALAGQRDQALEVLDQKIHDANGQINTARLALDLATQIYSQDPGRVVMAPVSLHSLVSAGKRLLTIESGGNGLEVMAYVGAEQGKNILPGMSVRVSPTNVRREEFGSILGRVVWVSPLPQSQVEVNSALANDDLSRHFMKDGPAIAIKIALVPDPSTVSGYRWTSAKAASIPLSSGSLAKVWVTVREDRPIALLIPALRQMLAL